MSSIGLTITDGALQFDDGTLAFDGLNLRLVPGKITVILGPSGCGKTTLLRVVGGLLPLSRGSLVFSEGDDSVLKRPPKTRFCFQEPRLLPWATVKSNIELPGQLGAELHPGRVDTLLKWVGLKLSDRLLRPHELSGGMQMRVGLARALYDEPDLLLLDEPFAALDELMRGSLDDLLLRLVRSRAMSALMVTHSVSEAVYLADEIWVLTPRPGRLLRVYESPFGERTPSLRSTKAFAEAVADLHLTLAQGVSGDAP